MDNNKKNTPSPLTVVNPIQINEVKKKSLLEAEIQKIKEQEEALRKKRQNRKNIIFSSLILAIISITILGTIILFNQKKNTEVNFVNPNINVYLDNMLYTGNLKLGQIYESKITFDLENNTDEVKTISITINFKYVALKEDGNFFGVTFSSFQSDGSGENTTVILTYDLEPKSTISKEIIVTFYPTAITSNFRISATPNNSDNPVVYLRKVEMGQN